MLIHEMRLQQVSSSIPLKYLRLMVMDMFSTVNQTKSHMTRANEDTACNPQSNRVAADGQCCCIGWGEILFKQHCRRVYSPRATTSFFNRGKVVVVEQFLRQRSPPCKKNYSFSYSFQDDYYSFFHFLIILLIQEHQEIAWWPFFYLIALFFFKGRASVLQSLPSEYLKKDIVQ